jgi:hypothetical protein
MMPLSHRFLKLWHGGLPTITATGLSGDSKGHACSQHQANQVERTDRVLVECGDHGAEDTSRISVRAWLAAGVRPVRRVRQAVDIFDTGALGRPPHD